MQPNNKPTKEMYVTRTTKGFWPYTIPTSSFEDSRYMAENEVSLALLIEKGIDITEIDQEFGQWLRNSQGQMIKQAQQYIQETCIVRVAEGVDVTDFRRDFCKMMQDSGLLDGEIRRDELYEVDFLEYSEDEEIEFCKDDFSEIFQKKYS